MRARNIKPGFFENEELAELSFECRLLYIGLWCYADREGRFEWRPKRIKALIFPYDLKLDIEKMLNVMTCKGHVMTYNCNGQKYGFIPTFKKHNNPHPHEAKSKCPDPKNFINQEDNTDVIKCNDMSVECNADIMNPDIMNPDIMNPDIMNPDIMNPDIMNPDIMNPDISGKPDHMSYKNIIGYLNIKIGSQFKSSSKATQRLIQARFNEGYNEDDFKKVIDIKVKKWSTDEKMKDFLRPQTLFSPKFESYLNEKPTETEEERNRRIRDEEADKYYRKHPERAKKDGYKLDE